MKEYVKQFLKYLIPLGIGFGIGILINLPQCSKAPSEPTIEYIPVHDTVAIYKERIVPKTRTKYVRDTVLLLDSVFIKGDTVYGQLPIEFKQYTDTLKNDSTAATLQIDYHGIASGIDSIKLDYQYFKEREIIIKEPKKVGWVWSFGPTIGYGGFVDAQNGGFGHGHYIGVSVGIGIGGYINK